ncbi:MAG: hypothetical protein JXR05_10115 [Flavobacteriaceae bacterium]
MKKILLLFVFFALFSCLKDESEPWGSESGGNLVVTSASGVEYPDLDPSIIYCGPGWGRKMCHFLTKYDGTTWTDPDNYYSDFSDIKFSNFTGNEYFISFFTLDSITSSCKGWKLNETIENGVKWNIKLKKDRADVLWFDYEYYGDSQDIEYTITYKYEVIDGLLHFSSTDGQAFIFSPSDRDYSGNSLVTDEIIRLEGCLF